MISVRRVVRASALWLACLSIPAMAQDPVVKPGATTLTRLASPATVVARQLQDGRIEVRWSAVAGAASYRITRSVPNLSPEAAVSPDPRDTVFVDGDVKQGFYYYYVVAGMDDAGQVGLKRGAAPVKAIISSATGGTSTAPANYPLTPGFAPPGPVAIRQDGATVFAVSWIPLQGASSFEVERRVYRSLPMDSTRIDPASGVVRRVGGVPASLPLNYRDSIPAASFRRWVQYRVVAITPAGPRDASSKLSVLQPATSLQPPTSTLAATTDPLATGAVAPALEFTIAVGRTATIPLAGGIAPAQWLSANPGIASVAATGAVTGRAAGVTSIIAFAPQSDGSVQVGVARVTVTP